MERCNLASLYDELYSNIYHVGVKVTATSQSWSPDMVVVIESPFGIVPPSSPEQNTGQASLCGLMGALWESLGSWRGQELLRAIAKRSMLVNAVRTFLQKVRMKRTQIASGNWERHSGRTQRPTNSQLNMLYLLNSSKSMQSTTRAISLEAVWHY